MNIILICSCAGLFFIQLLVQTVSWVKNVWLNLFISLGLSAAALLLFKIRYSLGYIPLSITGATSIYGLINCILPAAKEKTHKYHFTLFLQNGGRLVFYNPFDNFLIIAGQGGGKTGSLGKPLLEEYINNGFAGFVYDIKDYDYSQSAWYMAQKNNYPHKFYYISFTDVSRSYRFNIIKPSIVNEVLLLQFADDILSSLLADSKKDVWFWGALGVLKGVFVRFFLDYKQYCTVPHAMNFILHNNPDRIAQFLEGTNESRSLANGFLSVKDSPKTRDSILFSLTGFIGDLGFNKEICYILTGDDFNYDLIDPKEPKMVCVANSYSLQSVLSPIVALMVNVASRKFTIKNKIPCVFFLDEATTFRIQNFENMPSLLRQYLCSFVFLTQSTSKIEKQYGRLDKRSIESNFFNVFIGRTKDTEALKSMGALFSKKQDVRKTHTAGESTNSQSNSVSVSKTMEERYETNFYTNMNPGEFVGTTGESNKREFHEKFKLYDEPSDLELPIVRTVTEKELKDNYDRIVALVKTLK